MTLSSDSSDNQKSAIEQKHRLTKAIALQQTKQDACHGNAELYTASGINRFIASHCLGLPI
ncbi:hypothetical protein IQ268_03750 [Oculatella sp. LEGE 06141]|uniref:hypothetical protein n=1 Tax=Oculatella sp. LEGE 06141 TaxID=1828648 RepID=UPI0018803079|nr:hypothetical protein [Oculatella sp. LEGE 06141]MBE9177693.1 hypothetical protein [Oculatella sp. LEGE 06141]